MSVTFPLMLLGLGLAAIPILIHLIKRQQPKRIRFPAFRFLVQRQKTNLRKLRLRHLLLLLLRITLLVLACLALARPRLVSDLFGASADQPLAAVLLFDTSGSMEYQQTEGKTRLEEAKSRALALLASLPRASRVAVVDTASPIASGSGEFVNVDTARLRIESLQIRHSSRPVSAALLDVFQMLANVANDRADQRLRQMPRLICVFSDARRSSWDQGDSDRLAAIQDTVPPRLPRIKALAKKLPNRLDLLRRLREELPPPEGKDYPDQAFIDDWNRLSGRLPTAVDDEFPTVEDMKRIQRMRSNLRQWMQTVAGIDPQSLTPSARDHRERAIHALDEISREMGGARLLYVDVGVDNPADLALLELEFPDDGSGESRVVFAPQESFVLRAKIQATGRAFETSAVCRVGDIQQEQPVVLQKGQTARIRFAIDCRDLGAGPQQIEVSLKLPDLLSVNNRRFATFTIRDFRPVLIVTDEPASVSLLQKAIEFQTTNRFRVDVRSAKAALQIKPSELQRYVAVYVVNVVQPPAELWRALQLYVRQGGGVVIVPGEAAVTAAYNDQAEARSLLPGRLLKVQSADPGLVWDWQPEVFRHPLFKRFRDWKLAEVDFFRYPRRAYKFWRVDPLASPEVRVLIRYDHPKDPPPALLERLVGEGKVLLLTTRLNALARNDWNNYMEGDTAFAVVLPGELTRYLAGDARSERLNFICGKDAPLVRLPAPVTDLRLTLQGPGLTDVVTRTLEQSILRFPRVSRAGNYRLWAGAVGSGRPVAAFSLNLPPEESDLTPVPAEQLTSIFGSEGIVSDDKGISLDMAVSEMLSEPIDLFPWLMAGVLVFLAVENLMSNLFYRRAQKVEEAA